MRKLPILLLLLALTPARAMALNISELLSTIAMPLAVAAVSEIAGVPQDQLANFVATLNNANVPAPEVIEIVRYVPVALVVDNGTPFVEFVQQQVSQGITGTALFPVITQRIQTFYPVQTVVVTSPPQERVVVVERNFVPQTVITRVAEVRVHPHGGPPGQIKKQLGLQTGAEVVHGKKPGKRIVPMASSVTPPQPQPVAIQQQPPGKAKGHDEAEKEHGGGKGKGKGKGKGD